MGEKWDDLGFGDDFLDNDIKDMIQERNNG